jgi:beta-glucosidase
LEAWYPGEEGGRAVAEALFGDFNPGGRLCQTFYKGLEQLPAFDDYDIRKGRTYMYLKSEPLYPFGFGLSYTTFKYSDLKVSSDAKPEGVVVKVSVSLRNSGTRAGDEVAQAYAVPPQGAVGPQKRLVAFKRLRLKPGESKLVDLTFKASQLGVRGADLKPKVAQGQWKIQVGGSSAQGLLKAFSINE